MVDGAIKESDLIQNDGSIDKIINSLEELNVGYSVLVETIRKSAKDIVNSLKSVSVATEEGRKEIDMAAISANRLERAQKELAFAMSDTGKQVAILKDKTSSLNKETVNNDKQIKAAEGSYDRLNNELKEHIALWNSLTPAERAAADMGGELQKAIAGIRTQMQDINAQLNPAVEKITELQKAEQRLAYLQSEEGQKLIQIKQQISEVLHGRDAEKTAIDRVAEAAEKLEYARSAEYAKIQELNHETQEQQKIVKLTARVNKSAVGSYNQLAAQYELNKIKLNAMSAEERHATEAGKALEEETLNIYKQMIRLQEATGNHRLSVGNYKLAWNGLGNAMNQIVRELPSAAMGVNTFFLAISNNIPVLIDEIDKVRRRNKLAAAEGKATTSVIKTITSSIFSWQSALIVLLTVLSMHGKAILEWMNKLIKGRTYVMSLTEAVDNMVKELDKTNDSYGKNITSLKKLSKEWKNLTSDKERKQWIIDNKTAFDQLDVSVRNVSDAENIFADHTDVMVSALKARAKAAAAMKLASDKYEEALIKEAEAEVEAAKKSKGGSFGTNIMGGRVDNDDKTSQQISQQLFETNQKRRVQGLRDEAKALEKTADQYFNMAEAITAESDAALKAAGIEHAHKDRGKTRTPRLQDLTDIIWRNDLSIRKKYELSLSELQRNEFQKRRIEAIDQTNQTIREMQEKFRKNQVYLTNPDKKYKPLTEQQKAQIERQQNEIKAIIENAQRKLQIDLTNLEYEYEIDRNTKLRQVMKWRLKDIANNLEEEKQLRLKQLEEQEALYTTKGVSDEGGEVVVTGKMTPEEKAVYQRERIRIEAEYDSIILNMKAKSIEAELDLVKKGTEEELHLLVHRNEIARQLALAQNRLKPIEEQEDETLINRQYDKSRDLIHGDFKLNKFDQQQALDEAEFTAVKRSERKITTFKLKAEKERWEYMIELAKQGALDWSREEIEAAAYTVERLKREIKDSEDFFKLVGEKGFGEALLTKLGFDDDQIAAFTDASNIIIDNIKAITDAEVEAAEAAVALAEKRVEVAQRAYDAEIEARNNGYANNVATAKKELQQEKRNQQAKQKMLEEAQRRQEAINTVTQASSLVTASANLWSSFSGMGPLGPALAIAAIAAMWTSFAVAKVKAAQVAKASQEYGEGGLEFLEGGSHASGNDIDLQTTNSKGKNMRAEGGEALAIINKRNTRKYRRVLPKLVDSLNKGTFEDKFIGAFKAGDELTQSVSYVNQSNIDLSRLEEDVRALKRNNERKYVALLDGSYIETRKNVVRHIR